MAIFCKVEGFAFKFNSVFSHGVNFKTVHLAAGIKHVHCKFSIDTIFGILFESRGITVDNVSIAVPEALQLISRRAANNCFDTACNSIAFLTLYIKVVSNESKMLVAPDSMLNETVLSGFAFKYFVTSESDLYGASLAAPKATARVLTDTRTNRQVSRAYFLSTEPKSTLKKSYRGTS